MNPEAQSGVVILSLLKPLSDSASYSITQYTNVFLKQIKLCMVRKRLYKVLVVIFRFRFPTPTVVCVSVSVSIFRTADSAASLYVRPRCPRDPMSAFPPH